MYKNTFIILIILGAQWVNTADKVLVLLTAHPGSIAGTLFLPEEISEGRALSNVGMVPKA